jgi:hypothetical protein
VTKHANPAWISQAEYILQTNEENKYVIFENAVLHDNSAIIIDLDTKRDKLGGRARMQLKPSGHTGTKSRGYPEYQRKYKQQLECIIRGMFPDEDASDPNVWQLNFNSIVGGVCHQHPHCDASRVGTYQGLSIFPFVALHGFGIHPFSLWVLPQGFEYGFMHTFRADQIVFMRGDFVHAGMPSLSSSARTHGVLSDSCWRLGTTSSFLAAFGTGHHFCLANSLIPICVS